jgi:hypothetical protein
MYYIRINAYGQIAWKTMGYSQFLELDRYSGDGLSIPRSFNTYDEAVKHVLWHNARNNKTTYHVEDSSSPFVQQWLLNEPHFKMVDGVIQCITDYTELQASLKQWRLRNAEEYNTKTTVIQEVS